MSMEHVVSIRTYLIIFLALVAGTAITTAAAYVDLGPLNVVVMLVIAFAKATLVVLFFMHVKFTNRLTQLAAASGFLWLLGISHAAYLAQKATPKPA